MSDVVEQIRTLADRHTQTQIADLLKRTLNSISGYCRRNGIVCVRARPPRPDPVIWEALLERVRELADRGYSRGEIGLLVKKSRNSISGICWRYGIETRGGNRIRRWKRIKSSACGTLSTGTRRRVT